MNLRNLLPFCLLILSVSAFAQNKAKEQTKISTPGYGKAMQCAYEYDYSTTDSTKVPNGDFTIKGERNEKGVKEAFSLSGTAASNKLNGVVKANYSLEGVIDKEKHYTVFTYEANFKDGYPDGAMNIRSFGQNSSAYDVKANFNKGMLSGKFHFIAFVKAETLVSGNFNSEGEMDGEWRINYYDLKARKIERHNMTLSKGVKVGGENYNTTLEQEAKKYLAGKITADELQMKGIGVYHTTNEELVDHIKNTFRNRFIPFDSLATMDLSKIALEYTYLDYFPVINEKGFDLLLSEIDNYDGYRIPELSSFGINTKEGTDYYKVYDKSFATNVINAKWDDNQQCYVHFTDKQKEAIDIRLATAQSRWRKSPIAICKSNFDVLFGQNIVKKSASEISSWMTSITKDGYKLQDEFQASRYEEHTPIIDITSVSIEDSVDSTAIHQYINLINVANKDSVGYRTYEWTIQIRSTDSIYFNRDSINNIYNDLNSSFASGNFKRVKNDYDTINQLLKTIDENTRSFESIAKNSMQNPFANYSEYIKQTTTINHSDLHESIEHLSLVLSFQQEFKEWLLESAKVKELDTQIKDSKGNFSHTKSEYEELLKKTDLSWAPGSTLEKLIKFEDVQKGILTFIDGSCKVSLNHKKIRTEGHEHKDVINEYKKLIKNLDFDWSKSTDLKQIEDVLAIQEKTLEFISRRDKIDQNTKAINSRKDKYDALVKAYHKYIKNTDLSWGADGNIEKLDSVISVQDSTIKFISLRDKIVENDSEIHKNSRAYKAVKNAYNKYIDSADVAWTPEVNLSKLEAVIQMQESCKALLNRSNIKDINKTTRQEKIKSISEILQRYSK